jgi:hypothetical protein
MKNNNNVKAKQSNQKEPRSLKVKSGVKAGLIGML